MPSHTIFFCGCTFACAYCQNWEIAMHPESGLTADPRDLAGLLEEGIGQGSCNANFVGATPTPIFIPSWPPCAHWGEGLRSSPGLELQHVHLPGSHGTAGGSDGRLARRLPLRQRQVRLPPLRGGRLFRGGVTQLPYGLREAR